MPQRVAAASGTPEKQARETKSVVKEEVAKATEGFVTRAEFIEAMAELREEFRQEMADRDALAAWRAAGLLVAMTGIFSIIVKLL